MEKYDLNSENAYESLEVSMPHSTEKASEKMPKVGWIRRNVRKLVNALGIPLAVVFASAGASSGCRFDPSGVALPDGYVLPDAGDAGVDGGDAEPDSDVDADTDAGDAEPGDEICDDGVDNDSDGLTDCADTEDCENESCGDGCVCQNGNERETDCGDGVDNDSDGLTDCVDSLDCSNGSSCGSGCECEGGGKKETACGDSIDNDGDGFADCRDEDCDGVGTCEQPEQTCDDNIDNDGDGDTDCADSNCSAHPNCVPESDCADGIDNEGDGLTDCEDPDCDGVNNCEHGNELSCGDSIDNDADGDTDCDDTDCSADPNCIENCENGTDDDGDGFTDCTDLDCEGYVNGNWSCDAWQVSGNECSTALNPGYNCSTTSSGQCWTGTCSEVMSDGNMYCIPNEQCCMDGSC